MNTSPPDVKEEIIYGLEKLKKCICNDDWHYEAIDRAISHLTGATYKCVNDEPCPLILISGTDCLVFGDYCIHKNYCIHKRSMGGDMLDE